MHQTITLHTLNLHNVVCQLYLDKAKGEKKQSSEELLKTVRAQVPAPEGLISLAGGEVWVPCFPAPQLSGAYISPSSPSPLVLLGTWALQAVVDALTGT